MIPFSGGYAPEGEDYPCQVCPSGWTTPFEAATSADNCTGWIFGHILNL